MSSSNTEESRTESCSNQSFVIGYPVAPPGHSISLGIPACGGSSVNNNNNNNNGDSIRNTANANRPAALMNNNDDSECEAEWCGLLIIFMVVFFPLGVWFSNRPTTINPKFEIESIVFSPHNVSISHVIVECTMGILVSNLNNHTRIHYDHFEVLICHEKDQLVFNATVAPFYQGRKNQTKLIAKSQANFQGLDGDSVGVVMANKNLDGIVNFEVGLVVKLRFLSLMFEVPSNKTVVCMGVKVKFSPNVTDGTMIGGSMECETVRSIQE